MPTPEIERASARAPRRAEVRDLRDRGDEDSDDRRAVYGRNMHRGPAAILLIRHGMLRRRIAPVDGICTAEDPRDTRKTPRGEILKKAADGWFDEA